MTPAPSGEHISNYRTTFCLTLSLNREMRNFIDAVMLMESDSPDGWWIDENGAFHECDHRAGHHHADLAIWELDLVNDEGDEGEDAAWFLDHAIEEALNRGWVRASIYHGSLGIQWTRPLTPQTQRTLLTWLDQYAEAFRIIAITTPNGGDRFEQDARAAIRFVRQHL